MINRVVLVGRLVADPELRFTPNGVAFLIRIVYSLLINSYVIKQFRENIWRTCFNSMMIATKVDSMYSLQPFMK